MGDIERVVNKGTIQRKDFVMGEGVAALTSVRISEFTETCFGWKLLSLNVTFLHVYSTKSLLELYSTIYNVSRVLVIKLGECGHCSMSMTQNYSSSVLQAWNDTSASARGLAQSN